MNDALIHRLVREALAAGAAAPTSADECSCGKSAATGPASSWPSPVETVERMVAAGAARLTVQSGACEMAPDLARLIDHTALKAETTRQEVEQLCREAADRCFASVCINPCYVGLAAKLLQLSPVKVCTVIGFPLGATASRVKAFEAAAAIEDGATEIDMVLNVGALKSGMHEAVEADIRGVVEASHRRGALVKVILETALLTDEEKVIACVLSGNAGADFVKTSTGFAKGGATADDVALMRRVVGSRMGVKASGGVRSYDDARSMVESGASRIGASASVAIVEGKTGSGTY